MNSGNDLPNVLCLGVSYPSLKRIFEQLDVDYPLECDGDTVEEVPGTKTNGAERPILGENEVCEANDDTTGTPASSIQLVLDCVKKSYMTAMDGRDLARCLATEQHCQVRVYTVSQETGALYEPKRHMWANFNRSSFMKALQKQFGNIQFQQVILDYFWIPSGWDVSHWKSSFFQQTLVNLASSHVLRQPTLLPSNPNKNLGGVVYLPFCFHCFKEVVAHWDTLRQYYNLSFLRKGGSELNRIALWSGTQQIDPDSMQGILGKRRDQEEVYCSFGPTDVRGASDDPRVRKAILVEIARHLEDFGSIRFMALTRLAQDSTMGEILGLVPPDQVQRGFDHMSTSAATAKRMIAPTPLPITPLKRSSSRPHVVSPSPSPPPQCNHKCEISSLKILFSDQHYEVPLTENNKNYTSRGSRDIATSDMNPHVWANRLRARTPAKRICFGEQHQPHSPVQEKPKCKRVHEGSVAENRELDTTKKRCT